VATDRPPGALTRRQLLAGGALALAGGCRASAASPIEGAIVGAGHGLGHRLRESGPWPPPDERR